MHTRFFLSNREFKETKRVVPDLGLRGLRLQGYRPASAESPQVLSRLNPNPQCEN